MTQPTRPKFLDTNNNGLIGDQQTAIVALTDSVPAGTVSDTLDLTTLNIVEIQDDIKSLGSKINEIIEVLELHGLVADN